MFHVIKYIPSYEIIIFNNNHPNNIDSSILLKYKSFIIYIAILYCFLFNTFSSYCAPIISNRKNEQNKTVKHMFCARQHFLCASEMAIYRIGAAFAKHGTQNAIINLSRMTETKNGRYRASYVQFCKNM